MIGRAIGAGVPLVLAFASCGGDDVVGVREAASGDAGDVVDVDASLPDAAPSPSPSPRVGGGPLTPLHRLLYAVVDDGTVHVYDVDAGHREVKSFPTVTGVVKVGGVCASADTQTLFFSHERPEGGYVVAVDLRTDAVIWSHAYQPNVDRLACAPDGKTLYVPSNEDYTDDSLIVVDGATGAERTRVHVSPRPHDSLANLTGTHVYLETKTSDVVTIVDTATDTIVGKVGPFAGIVAPFTFDARETRMYANVYGVNGFQVADVATGQVLATASIPGQTASPGALNQHGVALDPTETEVWVDDHAAALVHVFDVTVTPPSPKRDVAVDYGAPYWITFSIAGDFAYVSGPRLAGQLADVVDTRTYAVVARVGASEAMLELDVQSGRVVQVGSQYGVGRVVGPH